MDNLYHLPALKMIRLMRKQQPPSTLGFHWLPGVWAIDTPTSRISLNVLVDLGNASYGEGTHWIEEYDSDPTFLPPVVESENPHPSKE
ncbi:MAG: hypothetical protein JWP29_414 [Rhodoferax sp.]|nr:hypothetical protein [Rhodoferax sp.]